MTPNARRNLRSSLAVASGLLVAALVAVILEGGALRPPPADAARRALAEIAPIAPAAPAEPSARDLATARTAWRYFTHATRPETGLADSVAGYPSTTIWDQASHVLALVAAHRLGLIDDATFDGRTGRVLAALGRLPLYEGRLPNKAYDTRSLAMVDYQNRPAPDGIGWSALDIARMLLALKVLETHAPRHAPAIAAVVARWDLDALAEDGELIGAHREAGRNRRFQEGRIGYEQYAARAVALWGIDAARAASATRALSWVELEGIEVPVDSRRASHFSAITPTLSEPYLLEALELGLGSASARLAAQLYRAQERRHERTGKLTFVSEDHLDRPPNFAYAAVYANGRAWPVVSESGAFHPDLRWVSFKAVLGWDAIYRTGYTARARALLEEQLADPERGWAAGLYEKDGQVNAVYSLNTNAVVLEAIHNIAFGPMLRPRLGFR